MALLMNDDNAIERAALHGVMEHLRAGLRAKIMERIEPDIQAAVEETAATLAVGLRQMEDFASGRRVLHLVVDGVKREIKS